MCCHKQLEQTPKEAGFYLLYYTILPCNTTSETPGALSAPSSSMILFVSHLAQLDPIIDDFEEAASCVTFRGPVIPLFSPSPGQCVSKGGIIDTACLQRAPRESVDFVSALNTVIADGLAVTHSIWIDIFTRSAPRSPEMRK